MGLKTMVLAGTTAAAMTLTAPAFAAAAPFAAPGHPAAAVQLPSGGGDHNDDDISGLLDESPVCSALDAETIPTGDVVSQCLAGTKLI